MGKGIVYLIKTSGCKVANIVIQALERETVSNESMFKAVSYT